MLDINRFDSVLNAYNTLLKSESKSTALKTAKMMIEDILMDDDTVYMRSEINGLTKILTNNYPMLKELVSLNYLNGEVIVACSNVCEADPTGLAEFIESLHCDDYRNGDDINSVIIKSWLLSSTAYRDIIKLYNDRNMYTAKAIYKFYELGIQCMPYIDKYKGKALLAVANIIQINPKFDILKYNSYQLIELAKCAKCGHTHILNKVKPEYLSDTIACICKLINSGKYDTEEVIKVADKYMNDVLVISNYFKAKDIITSNATDMVKGVSLSNLINNKIIKIMARCDSPDDIVDSLIDFRDQHKSGYDIVKKVEASIKRLKERYPFLIGLIKQLEEDVYPKICKYSS